MAKAVITNHMIANNGKTRIYDGDFIDLTSENEPQNIPEDDVVLLDEPSVPLPIGAPKNTPNKAMGLVIAPSQHSNMITKQFLVPSTSKVPSPGSSKCQSSAKTQESIILDKSNSANKKANINSEKLKQYKRIKPKPSTGAVSQNIEVEDCILVPTTSEINETATQPMGTVLETSKVDYNATKGINSLVQNPKIAGIVVLSKQPGKTEIPVNCINKSTNQQNKPFLIQFRKDGQSNFLLKSLNVLQNGQMSPVTLKHNSFTKPLQERWARKNVIIEESKVGTASTDQEIEIIENEAVFQKSELSRVENFLVNPLDNENPVTVLSDEEREVSGDDSTQAIIDERELICIESEKTNHEDVVIDADDGVVTPVDISKILKQANNPKNSSLKGRCECAQIRKQSNVYKGFTTREMRRPVCYKHLQALIKKDDKDIQDLKKSIASYANKFVICGRTINNFLPKVHQIDHDDTEEFTIEYINIEDQLNQEIYGTETIPMVAEVIAKVNEEVLQLKTKRPYTRRKQTTDDLKSKLAKPEAALKLIKKGLELIKSWSKETHSESTSLNKPVPVISRRKSVAPEPKRRAKTVAHVETVVASPIKVVGKGRGKKTETNETKQPVKRRTRAKKNELEEETVKKVTRKKKVETSNEVKTTVTKRGRKRKIREFIDPNDNELYLIKKIDILKDRRRK